MLGRTSLAATQQIILHTAPVLITQQPYYHFDEARAAPATGKSVYPASYYEWREANNKGAALCIVIHSLACSWENGIIYYYLSIYMEERDSLCKERALVVIMPPIVHSAAAAIVSEGDPLSLCAE